MEHKSCTATIYSQKHRQAERFEVRYYDLDGSQQRLTFGSYSAARKFAETVVQELARNRGQFVTLRGPEAYENQKANELLQPLGLSVLQAALA